MMEELAAGARRWGISLSPLQLQQFEVYYHELESWNQRVNLTSIEGYREVQIRHFLDSLSIALALRETPRCLEPGLAANSTPCTLIDIGTGAGLPALPLKIAFPDLKVVLVDSVAKKTAFLRNIVAKLGLREVDIKTTRAEALARLPAHREAYDLAVSRAVAPLATLLELTLPFLRAGGLLIAPKKGDVVEEVARAKKALATLGGGLLHIHELTLEGESRALVLVSKASPTPPAYPRRPGIPAKRPL